MRTFGGTIILLFLVAICRPVRAQWVRTALPGGRLGAVYSLCVKDSELFAGAADGVYRSEDNGGNWEKVNPLIPPRDQDTVPLKE